MKKITIILSLFIFLLSCSKQEDKITSDTNKEQDTNSKIEIKGERNKSAIIDLQIKEGTNIISELDCDTFDEEGKEYCLSEMSKYEQWRDEVTWEKVLKKGNEYIKTFDCNEIKSDYGKKYCKDYKEELNK